MFHRLGACCSEFMKFTRVIFQVLNGAWRLSALDSPRVTIFGGARLGQKSKYAQNAFELAQKFVKRGVPVLTGGGSGVMHAANCGAISKGKGNVKSIGITVRELGEGKNPCVQEYFELEYFFARKWLLTRYSAAFVVFPGGFGTLDELAEVLTLIQTKKLSKMPIVLVGREYWKDFMKWITDSAVAQGLISKDYVSLFTVTDDMDEAFTIVSDECNCIKKAEQKK